MNEFIHNLIKSALIMLGMAIAVSGFTALAMWLDERIGFVKTMLILIAMATFCSAILLTVLR